MNKYTTHKYTCDIHLTTYAWMKIRFDRHCLLWFRACEERQHLENISDINIFNSISTRRFITKLIAHIFCETFNDQYSVSCFENMNNCHTGGYDVRGVKEMSMCALSRVYHVVHLNPVFKLASVIRFHQKQIYNKNTQYKTTWIKLKLLWISKKFTI